MSLPYDYSRCPGDDCKLKTKCLRFLSPGRPDGHQAFTVFAGGDDCPGFIPLNDDQGYVDKARAALASEHGD